uniref:Uncharacterized protein n=1 Tax=Arundo donax TaxID=35708 RepID=A0A0A9BSM2_ARUDO
MGELNQMYGGIHNKTQECLVSRQYKKQGNNIHKLVE